MTVISSDDERVAPPLAHAVGRRPWSRSGLACSRRVSYSAGATPAIMPVSSVMTAVCTKHAGIDRQIEEASSLSPPPARTSTTRAARTWRTTPSRPPSAATSDGLGQQRADDPAAARADRGANRDLVLARRPLRDHQDRDVRARDEQRQQDGRAEDVGQDDRHLMADRRALDARDTCSRRSRSAGGQPRSRTRPDRVCSRASSSAGVIAARPAHDHLEPLVGRAAPAGRAASRSASSCRRTRSARAGRRRSCAAGCRSRSTWPIASGRPSNSRCQSAVAEDGARARRRRRRRATSSRLTERRA